METKQWRLLAFIVPVVVVVALVVVAALGNFGTVVTLETRGVDPPDLFRGDYVDLRYAVSAIDSQVPGWSSIERLPLGETVYLTLQPGTQRDLGGNPYWVTSRVDQSPVDIAGTVCVKATLRDGPGGARDAKLSIEQYFIQKDEDMEEWRDKDVSVQAKVRGCTISMYRILLDGVHWDG